LDIRYDRVFQTWSKAVLSNKSNLLILWGDANSVFTNNIGPKSVDEVIINFPEPPVVEGSQQHLITTSFLAQIHYVVKKGGVLTIVTDNKPYSRIISKALSQLQDKFESAFPQQYDTNVPKDYGSSYFDRFWTKGTLTSRFFYKYYTQ
jgi:tRNA G46 methylase TrmB